MPHPFTVFRLCQWRNAIAITITTCLFLRLRRKKNHSKIQWDYGGSLHWTTSCSWHLCTFQKSAGNQRGLLQRWFITFLFPTCSFLCFLRVCAFRWLKLLPQKRDSHLATEIWTWHKVYLLKVSNMLIQLNRDNFSHSKLHSFSNRFFRSDFSMLSSFAWAAESW